MSTAMIVGASRGIGAEFVRQYVADGWTVHATHRDAVPPTGDRDVTWHRLEVTDQASLERLVQGLGDTAIDVLILCAGILLGREMTADQVDRAAWAETFAVNAIAPLAIAGALRPHLRRGTQRKLVAVSSRLGSMGENLRGGLYMYRSSKAALNAVWRSLAIDWQPDGLLCTVLHPGWVRTDMGGPNGDIDARESVTGMRKVIAGLTPAQSGAFFNYDGTPIAW
ncbi:MAG TPA: SDR family oxidoreductase [Rhodopila sp.]|uniref:SDR family oxidoreductase n=1 Tax=Rhodopila sp. TaxID=2480087 RepID=UPI002D175403|nr:SDR family oxidoreductase [Rhodopila sp.]HVY13620.1 SDR family oxidoreductase [Rhodopila sp.]